MIQEKIDQEVEGMKEGVVDSLSQIHENHRVVSSETRSDLNTLIRHWKRKKRSIKKQKGRAVDSLSEIQIKESK